MKNRFFSYLLCAFIHTSSFLPYAFSMEFYERSDFAYFPHVVVIMGENEKDNNKVASLLMKNDSNIKLGDINITKFDPMKFYGCNNNSNLKVIVITYNPIIDNDFNKIPSIFKNNFDGMDIIIHVGDKNTFTFSKIKSFYDKLNEAWVGKDLYKTMVYSTNSEDGRMKMWYYLLSKCGRSQGFVPRQFFPIYNGTEKSLKDQSDYIQLNNYISRMPDARSIYAIDLNDKNATLQPIIEATNGVADMMSKDNTSWKIETLKKVKAEGMSVCSGGIIGMGETWEDRLDMAVSLAEVGVNSIPINALMPIAGTPLENLEQLTEDDILRTIAFFRYINPESNIRLAAGRALLTNDGELAFQAGASATITGNMLTTTACATIRSDKEMLTALGRDAVPKYQRSNT